MKVRYARVSSYRIVLQEVLDFVRDGDTFIVNKLDRCSRSFADLHTIINSLSAKGIEFKCTEQDIDTSTSTGRLMIGLLSIVSAFATDLRAERQSNGIALAKRGGVRCGLQRKLKDGTSNRDS